MNKRKILLLAALLSMVAILGVGGTLAYFTADDAATNTFTVGNVKIDLTEPNWASTGSGDAPEVYPGEALAKDPTIKNIGKNPCFVRVKVEGLDVLGTSDDMLIHVRTNYVKDALGENWVLHTDGYYYYTEVLAVGASTSPVFDSIVIPTALTNGDGETEYDIDVTAYAVQAQGAKPSFSAVEAMTVAEIAAWFETCAPDTW
nr:SipW-dependent-type signal peptide-containing protein [Clostridia bacterium]